MLRRATVAVSRCVLSGPTSSGARTVASGPPPNAVQPDTVGGEFAETNLGLMDATTLDEYDKMINGEHMEWDLYYYLSGKKPAPAEVVSTNAFALLKKFVDAKKEPTKR
uniref:Uncharacterized protein n=1 Tax=Pristionchus pacificus TaxID=54126 RepID=A0A2A6C8K9_PRIPA|eukprot:PDM74545.1 hypothetical protein PRIPAC_41901 [Pristionchus pacificus]